MKDLILASQNETIRFLPGQNITMGTPNVDVCQVEILRADNGRVSLTHVDTETDPRFMQREFDWLQNGNPSMPVHRISVRTDQPDKRIDEIMQARINRFEQQVPPLFSDT